VLSPGNNHLDSVAMALDLAVFVALFSEVVIPGVHTLDDLLTKVAADSVGQGVEVAAEIAKLKHFDKIARLNADQASIWTEIRCEECRCTNWFQFIVGKTTWDWVSVGEKKQVQCDLSQTDWGKKEQKMPDVGIDTYADESVLYYLSLEASELSKIKEQCAEQAKKSC